MSYDIVTMNLLTGVIKMKKIALCCSAGMSTSMLVNKMRKSAEDRGIEVLIEAFPVSDFNTVISENDCVLLAPQVRFKLNDFSEHAGKLGKKVELISPIDYGTMNGQKVLDLGLGLIE